jgi:Uma2 family endonuclease
MSVSSLVSLEDYLNTSYSPDREYVDGLIVERHVGERPHSLVQKNLIVYLQNRYSKVFVWPEQRVRTVPGRRSRVPDVCVTVDDPRADVFDTPPLVCIEILSRCDEVSDLLEKLAEYAGFGVPYIWVIDPRRMKAYTYSGTRLEEVVAGNLATANRELEMPFDEIFRGL